ncbi:MAG: hypothetical protein ACLTOI_00125 [Faecalibacterium sp.]
MGKTFVCSLCRNGIIGGGLYIDEQSITYSTQKLTVSPLYRNLVLPMNEIRELSWSQMVVPVAAISMKDGECYKFIIYNKSGFEKAYKQYSNHQEWILSSRVWGRHAPTRSCPKGAGNFQELKICGHGTILALTKTHTF